MSHTKDHPLAQHDFSALNAGFLKLTEDGEGNKTLSTEPGGTYELPTATDKVLGGVLSGGDVNVGTDGTMIVPTAHTHSNMAALDTITTSGNRLLCNGVMAAILSERKTGGVNRYTSSATYTAPAAGNYIFVIVGGGGGGGGGKTVSGVGNFSGGGGGGGGISFASVNLAQNATVTLTVGAAGKAGASGGAGGAGGTSSIAYSSTTVSAGGGGGGPAGAQNTTPASGGSGSITGGKGGTTGQSSNGGAGGFPNGGNGGDSSDGNTAGGAGTAGYIIVIR